MRGQGFTQSTPNATMKIKCLQSGWAREQAQVNYQVCGGAETEGGRHTVHTIRVHPPVPVADSEHIFVFAITDLDSAQQRMQTLKHRLAFLVDVGKVRKKVGNL